MYQLSPNIEVLFTEAGPDAADRVRAAAAVGFDAVEMWGTLGKDVDGLVAATADAGVVVTSVAAEPRTNFAVPGTDLTDFFEGLDRGVEDARRLGSPRIVVGSGIGFPGAPRRQNLERLVETFVRAAERVRGSGVKLVLEPVNVRVDHPGALLDRTAEAVTVARAVIAEAGPDSFGILYDLYHSITEGEDPKTELANAGELIDYVQIADVPGRGEPGSGRLDWGEQIGILRSSGYAGAIGLECSANAESAVSLEHIRSVVRST